MLLVFQLVLTYEILDSDIDLKYFPVLCLLFYVREVALLY